MSNFKVGDKVVAVRDVKGYDVLVAFKEYTVCAAKEGWVTLDNGYMYSDRIFDLAHHNGVDATGQPLNFKNEMMKPFMRVVRSEGTVGIVVPSPFDGLIVVGKFLNGCTWSSGQDYMTPLEKYNEIIEVYDAPYSPGNLLDADSMGNLIWKRTKPLTEQEGAVQQLENTIKDAQEKLEALKATL